MAFITNTDTSVLPYNNDFMKYDIDRRQYVLTEDGYNNLSGQTLSENFDTEDELQAFLYEISDDVYQLIYDNTLIASKPYKQYTLAKNEEYRELLKLALFYQARFAIRSGGHLLKDMHGVNIEKGKAIDLTAIRGRVGYASQCISILNNNSILYGGFLPTSGFEDDGTY